MLRTYTTYSVQTCIIIHQSVMALQWENKVGRVNIKRRCVLNMKENIAICTTYTLKMNEEKYLQRSTGNATIVVPRLMIELPLSRRCPFRRGKIIPRTNIFVGTAQWIATLHWNWRQVLAVGVAFHTGGRPMSYLKSTKSYTIFTHAKIEIYKCKI